MRACQTGRFGGVERRLHLPHAVHQHLPIVQPAEQPLHPSSGAPDPAAASCRRTAARSPSARSRSATSSTQSAPRAGDRRDTRCRPRRPRRGGRRCDGPRVRRSPTATRGSRRGCAPRPPALGSPRAWPPAAGARRRQLRRQPFAALGLLARRARRRRARARLVEAARSSCSARRGASRASGSRTAPAAASRGEDAGRGAGRRVFELEHRQHLAQPPCRDPGPVHGPRLALLTPVNMRVKRTDRSWSSS